MGGVFLSLPGLCVPVEAVAGYALGLSLETPPHAVAALLFALPITTGLRSAGSFRRGGILYSFFAYPSARPGMGHVAFGDRPFLS